MRFRSSKRGNKKKKEKKIERKKINSMVLLLNKFQEEFSFKLLKSKIKLILDITD